MTATALNSIAVDQEDGATETSAAGDDTGAFLAAVATLQRETVRSFEDTVGRLTGLAMSGAGRNDRELIMTLQDFDRIQQEFAALGDMLARFGMAMQEPTVGSGLSDRLDRHVIAGISIHDLKERLLRYYRGEPSELEPTPDEAVF
jgi:hypothetical protein